ncbi:MAG: polysaccharide deacetylase family protein [Armatimonas sp.]
MKTQAPNQLSAAEALKQLQKEHDRFWQHACKEVYRSSRELLAQHEDELDRGVKLAKLIRGKSERREIALTFDDGPHPKFTPRLLAILARYQVPAAFFVVGERAEQYPALVRAEAAQGHMVANHTYHHVSLIKIPPEMVADEIDACGDVIRNILGATPRWFRPPGGEYNTEVARVAERLGYTIALWTDDPGDYASPGAQVILQRTLSRATPGAILLLHDGIEQTIQVLPQIIESLKKQGYTFVSLKRLAQP